MSLAPSYVAIKRRRSESPLSALVLEEPAAKHRCAHVEYRLESISAVQPSRSNQPSRLEDATSKPTSLTQGSDDKVKHVTPSSVPRRFNLAPLAGRKRSVDTSEELPTFVESKRMRNAHGRAVTSTSTKITSVSNDSERPLKRPVKRNAVKTGQSTSGIESTKTGSTPEGGEPSEELSDALHQFALDELAAEQRNNAPPLKYLPRTDVPRRRDRFAALNGASTASPQGTDNTRDQSMEDADDATADYVYDIYVRRKHEEEASATVDESISASTAAAAATGILVITEQDEPLWQTYLEDSEDNDKEFSSDDDDENAEGYYGADYPEDEVASDDEYGGGAYGYRRHDSDDEQWDHHEGDAEFGQLESSDEDVATGGIGTAWKRTPWLTRLVHGPAQNEPATGDQKNSDDEEL